jgi:hypothetical protein
MPSCTGLQVPGSSFQSPLTVLATSAESWEGWLLARSDERDDPTDGVGGASRNFRVNLVVGRRLRQTAQRTRA